MNKEKILVGLQLIGVIFIVISLSFLMNKLISAPTEKPTAITQLSLTPDMTISDIARTNGLKIESISKALKINQFQNADKTLNELGIAKETAISKIKKNINYENEEKTKNFVLIKIKFILWLIAMIVAFFMLKKNKITPSRRKSMLFISFAIFGIILGTEPNPMSMVKDIITNYAIKGIIFPPRVMALLLFLLIVFLANKFVCAWACQFGTLQDFIFRLNRKIDDRKAIITQYKVPFYISNSIRIIFVAAFSIIAFVLSTDIIEHINPFTIFKPAMLSIGGIIFLLIILTMSLVIYRPWCHFFCPFGLAGWLIEKFSIFKIKVNYDSCVACEACSNACPTTVMGAILKHEKTIPDCFSCGTCIDICPTNSISFAKGKRDVPKPGKLGK